MRADTWILRDFWMPKATDLAVLKRYLKDNSITPSGCFCDDLKDENWYALQFPIYAVVNFCKNEKLKKRSKHLQASEVALGKIGKEIIRIN
jgi:hypothetical protein